MEKSITTDHNQVRYRIQWIDELKGVAILSVVLGHTLLGYAENNVFIEPTSIVIYIIKQWIYTWHMPLFFTISGFTYALAYINKKNNTFEVAMTKIKIQAINLLLIFLIFQVTLCGLKIIFSTFVNNKMSIKEMLINLFLPNTLMWYIWVLVIYYLVFGFLTKIKAHNGKSLVFNIMIPIVLIILDIFQKSTTDIINWHLCIGNLLHCAIYFWLGIALCRQDGLKKICKKLLVIISIGVVLAYLLAYIISYPLLDVVVGLSKALIEETNAVGIIILLFATFSTNVISNKFLIALGKQSLVIYLLHTYMVTILKVIFIRLHLCSNILSIPVLLITFLIPIIISYGIAMLSKKIKILEIVFHPILITGQLKVCSTNKQISSDE